LIAVRDFFNARLGPAHGFRYKDPVDFTTDPAVSIPADFISGSTPAFDDVIIGTGDGSQVAFQMIRKYTSGGVTRNRNITKPYAPLKSGVDGVEKTEDTDYTVDYTTGIITYATPPPDTDDVTAGCEFHVPCRFDTSLDEGLLLTLTSFGGGSMPSIPIIEELQAGATADEFYYGESGSFTFSSDLTLTANSGRAIRLSPTGPGLSVFLPATTGLETGAPWFLFKNVAVAQTVTIKSAEGTTIFTMPALSGATILLVDVAGVKTWFGIG
jgi:uncharacterized protein (TIGR02217 family)